MRSLPKLLAVLWMLGAGVAQASQLPLAALKCDTQKVDPFLDFEFRFVAGNWFYVPVKQFWGERISLNLTALVEPIDGTVGKPARLRDRFANDQTVPEGTKGSVYFAASFSLGVGRYRMTWQLMDDRGRKCRGQREFKVSLPRGDARVRTALRPGQIVETTIYAFRDEPYVERPHLRGEHRLKVFISVDILGRRGRTRPRLLHLLPHFSTLRHLSRSKDFNQFSVVVFSFEDQKTLWRQDYDQSVEFPALRSVLDDISPETVDVNQLGRGSELLFFRRLVREELYGKEAPDAVVFIGQEMMFGKQGFESSLAGLRNLGAVFAFMDCSRVVFRGAIGSFVRSMQGKEYRLNSPMDLAKAIAAFERQVRAGVPQ